VITIGRILCPTDFSASSRRALDHAAALGRWYEAEVTVLHVARVVIPTVAALAYVPAPAWLSPEARERLGADLRLLAKPVREDGVRVRVELAEGNPATEILARAHEFDLVVMATHGRRGGLERWVGGSVTEAVLRKAPCPVLTVTPRSRVAPTARFTTILCPVDFSPASEQTAHEAAMLAGETQARLVLLHVLERPARPPSPVPPGFDRAAYRANVEEDVRRRLRRLSPATGGEAVEAVAWSWPAREILRVARERRADLIVMGAHGGPLDSTLFGSVAHKVVRRAPCPVLVIRARASALPEAPPEMVGVGRED
jgi:nucleotide-binding universal stress UspA family protein